jgi:hypothetical protein
MLDLIFRIKKNPLYMKDKIIQDRINSRKRFRFLPAWLGYLSIFLIPMIFVACAKFHDHDMIRVEHFRSCIIFSCYLQIIYFSYRALSNSFSLIVREREQRTFDSIITTIISPGDILLGKFWIASSPLLYELTLLFPVFVWAGLLTDIPFFKLLSVYLFTLGIIIFSVISCLWASARGRNTQNAHAWAGGIMGGIIFGTFIVTIFLSIICTILVPKNMYLVNQIASFPLFFNPFYSLTMILRLEDISMWDESQYFLMGPLLGILLLYPFLTVWFWKDTLKQLSVVPEE